MNFFDEHLDQKSRYAVEYASYAAEYEVALHEAVEHLQIVEEQLGNLMHLPEPDHAISRTITARDVEKVLRAEEERYA